MQNELQTQYPLLRITLGGINQAGHESGNPANLANRDLVFLQDVDSDQDTNGEVWESWQAEWRDVFIVDGSNEVAGIYNLTTHNLATPANYSELKGMLIDAAMAGQKPWQNPSDRHDVDGDQFVVALDALVILNSCNTEGPRELPPPTGTRLSAPYYDVDGDGFIAPVDALNIINLLNSQSPGNPEGEGEGPGQDPREARLSDARIKQHDALFADLHAADRHITDTDLLDDSWFAAECRANDCENQLWQFTRSSRWLGLSERPYADDLTGGIRSAEPRGLPR